MWSLEKKSENFDLFPLHTCIKSYALAVELDLICLMTQYIQDKMPHI